MADNQTPTLNPRGRRETRADWYEGEGKPEWQDLPEDVREQALEDMRREEKENAHFEKQAAPVDGGQPVPARCELRVQADDLFDELLGAGQVDTVGVGAEADRLEEAAPGEALHGK